MALDQMCDKLDEMGESIGILRSRVEEIEMYSLDPNSNQKENELIASLI